MQKVCPPQKVIRIRDLKNKTYPRQKDIVKLKKGCNELLYPFISLSVRPVDAFVHAGR